ncbi:MAG: InlB B-repeat-containing protein [Treponemataceae bacterium]|nr:InlB B-repeat-containing protein [Treponemataceae bacterium]
MKKTTLFAKLLAGTMTVFFLMGGGVSCSDGSDKDTTPETKYYTVTFDSKGGSEVASQKVEEGKLATKPDKPKNGDAPFLNWLKDGKPFNFSTPITADITLIAEWGTPGATIWTITFDSVGGTAIDPQNVESGKTADEPSAPTKDGYIFLGWYKDDNEFDFTIPITDHTELTAKWEVATTKPGDGEEGDKKPEEPPEPIITGPVAGGVRDLKASNEELETAYITWKAADNAKWYNVYVSPNPATADSWVKLDGPLVRQYKDYFRADALGLAAGKYDMKVVPVSGEDKEATEFASAATDITVFPQDRSGYAFADGNVPGAYNMDGTLKTGAQVVYVTSATAKTVKATVGGKEFTGFQSILDERKQSAEPLCFRIVGTVSKDDLDHISSSAEGLQIKGADTVAKGKATSNITIEGVGSDGTINGFGMLIRNCKNVEIKNLGIVNFMDDGVSVDTGNSNLWMHNLDIFYGNAGGDSDQKKGDGSLDIKLSQYCTVAYNHFWDSGKCCLLDAKAADSGSDYITYHHNWFDHSDSRHARVRNSKHTHVYNNYYDGNSKYGVGAAAGSTVFVENNYFRSTAQMMPMIIGMQAHDIKSDGGSILSKEVGGMIKAFGNKYDCSEKNLLLIERTKDSPDTLTEFDCYTAATRDEVVASTVKTKGGSTYNNFDTATDMYTYSVDTAEQAREKVVRYAGRVGGGDLKWEFNNATEDKNYEVIPGLKSAVTSYKTSVEKIGGGGTSTTPGGGDEGGNEGGGEGGGTTTNPPVTVDGQVTYIMQDDGIGTKYGITVSGNLADVKSGNTTDKKPATINGITFSKVLKLESTTSISFTPTQDMTLKVYVSTTDALKVAIGDNAKASSQVAVAEGDVFVLTLEVKAGTKYTLSKDKTACVYMLTLTPKA